MAQWIDHRAHSADEPDRDYPPMTDSLGALAWMFLFTVGGIAYILVMNF